MFYWVVEECPLIVRPPQQAPCKGWRWKIWCGKILLRSSLYGAFPKVRFLSTFKWLNWSSFTNSLSGLFMSIWPQCSLASPIFVFGIKNLTLLPKPPQVEAWEHLASSQFMAPSIVLVIDCMWFSELQLFAGFVAMQMVKFLHMHFNIDIDPCSAKFMWFSQFLCVSFIYSILFEVFGDCAYYLAWFPAHRRCLINISWINTSWVNEWKLTFTLDGRQHLLKLLNYLCFQIKNKAETVEELNFLFSVLRDD